MKKLRANIAVWVISLFGLIFMLHGCASQPSPQPGAEQPPSAPMAAISGITASETPDMTYVTISADGPLTFSSLKQPDPLAVVLYFPETTVKQLPPDQMLESNLIKRVVARDGNGSNTARVEIQLAADVPYTAIQEDNHVKLAFDRSAASGTSTSSAPDSPPMVAATADQGNAAEAEMASSPGAEESRPAVSAQATNVPGTTAWVNKIDFLSESAGKSTLVVGTTHAVDYRIKKTAPKKIEIRLLNTRIPAYRQRPLITTRFTSAVDRVTPYQPARKKNESVISIEMRESVPYFTEQADNLLLVHFEASAIPPKPLEQAQLPAWKQSLAGGEGAAPMEGGPLPVSESMRPPVGPGAEPGAEPAAEDEMLQEDVELRSLLSAGKRHYTGEKIALDFYDTDIKNVFRILREVSGKNFAIDKDVTGKVTMTLDQPVPWDQVLDLVLRMNQLGMTQEGSIIRIATLETLKKEDDLRRAKLEALKKAREEAKALEPLVTKYIPVSYSNAAKEVKPHIEEILTKDRGSVTVDEKNNQIIVTDTAAKVRQAEDIIRRIDKVTAQVIIEARVVEVSNNFSKELGITWDLSYGPGVIPGSGGFNASSDVAMNFPSASTSSIGMSFSRLSGVPFVLNARLNALETTGNGRILSSPKILTLDNKKAKIKQGVEFPYLERDSSGGSSVKFKNIDLLLEVTPHVTPDNRISLIIYITKNDVAGITAGVPSVATNEAQTELLVNDGDTIVIGGIIKSSENSGQTGFPVMSHIPLLGWLFRNRTDSSQSNELLIFITPRIVQLEQSVAQSTIQ